VIIPTSTSIASPSPTTGGSIIPTSSLAIVSSLPLVASVGARQASSITTAFTTATEITTNNAGESSLSGSNLGQANPTVAVLPNTPDTPLIQIGPYSCTASINLSTFTSLLLDYIQKTQNTLEAHLLYVILNIHVAASTNEPTAPASAPSSLPGSSSFLASQFAANLSTYLYTPTHLRTERADINSSWYTVQELYRPVDEYYTITLNDNNVASTESGWPSESYLEFSKSKRLLLGWGMVDPQMAKYNFTEDASIIFPGGYIQDLQSNVNATGTGLILNGCFFRNDTEDLSQTNSSWAMDGTFAGFDYPTSSSSSK
jgi:hypothetical protein